LPSSIVSSIIAGNTAATNPDVAGDFIDRGNNLIGDATGSSGFTVSTLVGDSTTPIDPLLGSLQDNGGSTLTQALLPSSPAIDAGSNPDNLTTDQRGTGFERIIGLSTDIGAFEFNPAEIIDSNSEDRLRGTDNDDRLLGLSGDDRIRGRDGDDILIGGAGNDRIRGDDGNDILIGGLGNDVLFGNDGSDTFVLAAGVGIDTIRDFETDTDLIGLAEGLGFNDLSLVGDRIILTATTEVLGILDGVNAETLTESDFTTV
jgi:Ca2+-binding RTX toxin-like protein